MRAVGAGILASFVRFPSLLFFSCVFFFGRVVVDSRCDGADEFLVGLLQAAGIDKNNCCTKNSP
jgi:hypothetical protein